MAKVNYLNNKDILAEIQKSKASYSSFVDEKYQVYDEVVQDIEDITPELILATKEKRAKKMMAEDRQRQKDEGLRNSQISVEEIDPESIETSELVWRVMTWDHIPDNAHKRNKKKDDGDDYVKILFPPFKHFIIEDEKFVEVGRSHWEGGIHNGYFSQEHGRMTNELCRMFMLLVERYGSRGNWRGYTYVDEMKARALLQLTTVGLQFDESRSEVPNPFSYYTVVVQNAFTSVLNMEKKNQNIRDDVLIMNGATPSITRQVEHEHVQKAADWYAEKGIQPSDVKPNPKGRFQSKATLKSVKDKEAKEAKAREEAEKQVDKKPKKLLTESKAKSKTIIELNKELFS